MPGKAGPGPSSPRECCRTGGDAVPCCAALRCAGRWVQAEKEGLVKVTVAVENPTHTLLVGNKADLVELYQSREASCLPHKRKNICCCTPLLQPLLGPWAGLSLGLAGRRCAGLRGHCFLRSATAGLLWPLHVRPSCSCPPLKTCPHPPRCPPACLFIHTQAAPPS